MAVRREDRFPLLFMVNPDNNFLETPPYQKAAPSERDLNVTRGAAAVISRWPQHVHTSSRLAAVAMAVILCGLLTVVALVSYTSMLSLKLHENRFDNSERLAACRQNADIGFREGTDVEALVKAMFPISRAWEFFADEDRVFFVINQGEELTQDKLWAIQSAAVARHNGTVFLLVLVHKDKVATAKKNVQATAEEAAFSQRVRVVNVDVTEYLNNTPLKDADNEGQVVVELATRLVTLWRFGGLSLSMDVVTLHNPKKLLDSPKNAYLDKEGHVISSRIPCHAFVFQAMKTLAKLVQEERQVNQTFPYSVRNIITACRQVFCRRPHCRNNVGSYRKCPGLRILEENIVGLSDQKSIHSGSTWSMFSEKDVKREYFQDICGFSLTTKKE